MNQNSVKQIMDNLTQVTDLLYQENVTPAYAQLAVALPQLEQVIMQVNQEIQLELTEKLRSALEAMEDGDNTLLADIIQYEILEQLKMFSEE